MSYRTPDTYQLAGIRRGTATLTSTLSGTTSLARRIDLMVISVAGNGIAMRPDALREATARAASAAIPKLETWGSPGRPDTDLCCFIFLQRLFVLAR